MLPDFSTHIELLTKCDEGAPLQTEEREVLVARVNEIDKFLCDLQATTPFGHPEGTALSAEDLDGLRFGDEFCTSVDLSLRLYAREVRRAIVGDESIFGDPSAGDALQRLPGKEEALCSTFEYYIWRAQAHLGLDYVETEDGFPVPTEEEGGK